MHNQQNTGKFMYKTVGWRVLRAYLEHLASEVILLTTLSLYCFIYLYLHQAMLYSIMCCIISILC